MGEAVGTEQGKLKVSESLLEVKCCYPRTTHAIDFYSCMASARLQLETKEIRWLI